MDYVVNAYNIKLFAVILLFSFVLCDSHAQKEDNVWLWGASSENTFLVGYQFGNTVFDFSDVEPKIYYDSLVTR